MGTVRRRLSHAMRFGSGSLAIFLTACAVEQVGIDPPDKELFFPSGLALDPTGRWLYVTNGNADLAFNAGTLLALDLTAERRCIENRLGPGRESCDEEKLVDDQVRIGSFAGEIEIRSDGGRLYFPTRGDPNTITWVDVNGGSFTRLEEVTELKGDEGSADPIPDEPFGMTLLEGCPYPRLLVTHLSRGVVSLLDECEDGMNAVAVSETLFPQDRLGRRRAYAIAPRLQGECDGFTYVTSSSSSRVAMVLADVRDVSDDGCLDPDETRLLPGPSFGISPPLDDAVNSTGREQDGTDTRGLAFSSDGDRAWMASREPPSLVLVDTNIEDGLPRNRPEAVVEVCPEPSVVELREVDGRALVYVVCFATSEIYVVDGEAMSVLDVIETGRGPASLEFDEGGRRAFVAHFAENTIGEMDLDPTSPHYHRMIRTIGLPEPLLE